MIDDEREDEYDRCAACGKSVFPGVSECPYCHEDPYLEMDACTYCGKSISPGVAECPYCKQYTDGLGPRGMSGSAQSHGFRYWAWVVVGIILIATIFFRMFFFRLL